ncbi:MAG: molybdenum cofactor biosynthesis protein A [Candidatus Methanoperedens nitroreducens]|uniref:Molybdenum cofactor biosynthesis protein A n=1 Tax=Candidatus Methanoperedens nitratireducens TaxID=1392998 RepID=A0A0P8E1T5_9EURY|nr:radical SAM protein [Candidatus Methanoperedens sp. BLZ2]KAB2943390.1 MAG: radical SAM protein [Candidatus Methanoperedens sp.]KPQ44205.1 MAG: molybdenum cofactor biosynthesis protein A [Candidatus Methanoperedens sp. BLZ1]MBZ0173851.1 radical SAM protein [Candidatus Methanoperedens nitroreducens]MCX9077647.1 radical SAM protein [Candidatus Methanoperedens sp.]
MAKRNNILIRDIPLFGCIAFGIIDRGTNVLQVRPISECPISCIFCSTDAGPYSHQRISEYMVDLSQLLPAFEWAASYKEIDDIEAHIDTVGEPAMYPQLVDLVQKLSENKNVRTISMQTNGVLLNTKLIDELDSAGLSRINMSIEALDPELAKRIAGIDSYNIEKVRKTAEYIAMNTDIDLLIAPVWLPGINDEEIPKLIEFALSIGAGKKWPALGIQKFLSHKNGRKPGVKVMSWEKFYSQLEEWEKKFQTKLILSPQDFGSHVCKALPRMFRRNEKVKVKVIGPGWMKGEKLAIARDRVLTIVNAGNIPVGKEIRVRIERVVDGIYMAR